MKISSWNSPLRFLKPTDRSSNTPSTPNLDRQTHLTINFFASTPVFRSPCFTMSEQRKAVIKNADMGDQMQQDAVDIASKALSEYNIEKVCRTATLSFGCCIKIWVLSWQTNMRICRSVFSKILFLWYLFTTPGRGSIHQEGIWSQARTNVVSSSFVCLRYLHAFLSMDKCCSQTRFLAWYSNLTPCYGRHVIVGRNFGSYVTHETKHFIYFYLGQVAILLFKSG